MSRSMALDIGDARIGVALSDELGITTYPHATISRAGRSIQAIIEVIQTNDVATVVIGIPYDLNGAFGVQARKVQEFATELHQACLRRREMRSVNFVFFDERFSTQQSERLLVGSRLKNRERSAALDQISAAILLDAYLTSQPSDPAVINGS